MSNSQSSSRSVRATTNVTVSCALLLPLLCRYCAPVTRLLCVCCAAGAEYLRDWHPEDNRQRPRPHRPLLRFSDGCRGVRMPLYHNTTIHYTTLHYTTLHYATLHYTTLHYTTLHYTTLYYTTLHHNTLYYIILH